MNYAVLIQPHYPPGPLRRFVSMLKPDSVLYLPNGGCSEYEDVAAGARARGLIVHRVAEPGHERLDGLVVLRDRNTVVPAELKARAKGLPVAMVLARVWAP